MMSIQKVTYKRNKPTINIGTVGHIDHGKTTLTSTLTIACNYLLPEENPLISSYESIDKAPEEKLRKITINASVIEYTSSKKQWTHVDCPGHADYVKNMITGASSLDAAIFVISAAEGPKSQTREHLLLTSKLGIKNIVVFLNKIDMFNLSEGHPDNEDLQFLLLDIEQTLEKYGYTNVPIILGSATLGQKEFTEKLEHTEYGAKSILKLLETMEEHFEIPDRNEDLPLYCTIENVYQITGRGVVATAPILQGTLTPGKTYDLLGGSADEYRARPVIVKEIEMFRKILNLGIAGDNVGILTNIKKDDISRGMVIAEPKKFSAYKKAKVEIYVLRTEEGGRTTHFKSGYRPQFFIGTFDVTGSIILEDTSAIVLPGDVITATIELDKFTAMRPHQKFSIREGISLQKGKEKGTADIGGGTVGSGVVIEFLSDTSK